MDLWSQVVVAVAQQLVAVAVAREDSAPYLQLLYRQAHMELW
jgi:hypothetical protein